MTSSRRAGELVAGLVPDADVAMLYSHAQPVDHAEIPAAVPDPDGGPDSRAYQGLFEPFYRGAFDAGLQVRILHAVTSSADDRRAGVSRSSSSAGLYIADDETLDWLRTTRSPAGTSCSARGPGTPTSRRGPGESGCPRRLADAAGVWYDEFSNLADARRGGIRRPGAVRPSRPGRRRPAGSDGLRTDGATVLARYGTRTSAGGPPSPPVPWARGESHIRNDSGCLVAESFSAGRALHRGVWGARVAWEVRPASVTSAGATAADGRRLRFLHNWSWDPATVTAPVTCNDVLSGKRIEHGDSISLTAWDVRVLAEDEPEGEQ